MNGNRKGKCVMKSRKRQITEGIEFPNQGRNRTLGEKETYKYLEILGADTIKQVEKKIVSQTNERTTRNQVCCRNLIKEINTWAVFLVSYSGPFFKWTR